jgi:hypothetical protein
MGSIEALAAAVAMARGSWRALSHQKGSSTGAGKRGCSDESLDPAGPLALLGVARPRPEFVRGVVAVKNHGVSSGTAKSNQPFLCTFQQRSADASAPVVRVHGEPV